ncbi:MAG: glucosaminidase domain-containing protein [Agarilytica sp.]
MKTAIAIVINLYLIFTLGMAICLSQYEVGDMAALTQTQPQATEYSEIPDFASIQDIAKKKQAFFDYFAAIVSEENDSILKNRDRLIATQKRFNKNQTLNSKDESFIQALADKYDVNIKRDTNKTLEALLLRVNAVPVSLALAQAANESAWGTSRFAREGNNFFGQWCFKEGCGIVPAHRPQNSHHEVRIFKSASASVKSYIHNINTHIAYEALRLIRAQAESESLFPSGVLLAEGLLHYSARGHAYVEEIQSMIEFNQLDSMEANSQIGKR